MVNMVKERKQGERYPPGYTEREIIKFVSDYPDGIKEPEIRKWLRENHGIREKKGIINHLQKLKEKKFLIKQTQIGKENIWKPNLDLVIFKTIYSEMQKENDIFSFFNSEYAQRMISLYPPLLGYDLPDEVTAFFREGMKLSPTFLQYKIFGSPEVKVAKHLLKLTIRKRDVSKWGDHDHAIDEEAAGLYASLLIDANKHPELKAKITDFVGDQFETLFFYFFNFARQSFSILPRKED